MGIPRITSAIWVRVRITVTGDAHITRVLGMGMPTSMQHPLVRMVPTMVPTLGLSYSSLRREREGERLHRPRVGENPGNEVVVVHPSHGTTLFMSRKSSE